MMSPRPTGLAACASPLAAPCAALVAILFAACSGAPSPIEQEPAMAPRTDRYPATERQSIVETIHGVAVADPYRWLEDAEAKPVQAWMKAQNDHTRAHLDALPGHDGLERRLADLAYVESVSTPYRRGDRYFYSRRHADKEKAVIYWREGDGPENVLLDPNAMSTGGRNVSIGRWAPDFDGRNVAYGLKENNADEATLYVMDVASQAVSEIDVIPGAKYASPSWTPDGKGFYYTWLPTDPTIPVAERPGHALVKFHALGTDPESDPIIHPALGDPTRFISPYLTRDGRWLFIYKWHGWSSVDIVFRDLQADGAEFRPFFESDDHQAYVIGWRDHFYIVTNEGAPRWRIFKTPADRPAREGWTEIVPQLPDAVIDGVQIIGDKLVLHLLVEAASALELRELSGEKIRDIPLPGIGSTGGLAGEPDQPEAFYAFSSFTTPTRIYRTDVASGETALWAEVKLPVDASKFTAERRWYTSKDGTKVSMFVLRRADLKGPLPTVLYGYGGFQVSLTPSFSANLVPWLEAGGAYAVAHLRGGGEYGEAWHRDGMLDKKQNVFDDFIAAAEYLIEEGETTADKLAIYGGSNGGLLVGAAMTQRPELFAAVVCGVPLLDMVRYHQFGSGQTWTAEYGSAEDPEQFATLYAYSPYHKVTGPQPWPATLFLSADNDDRVDPMHARKMAAVLQHSQTADDPILLRIEQQAGHGGSDRTAQRVARGVDLWAFLMAELGLTPPTLEEAEAAARTPAASE